MKEYKAGVIGCGSISPMHLESIRASEGVVLHAVCDKREERAREKAGEYGCRYYTDYMEMLNQEELDVVHLCTPHYLHAPMAIYAANKGVHVLTEKPMSTSLKDADAMIEACRQNQVALGVIFQNRYNPGAALIKRTLESGELGSILSGRCSVTWHRSRDYYLESDWKGTWEKEGGGVLINQAIHTMDLLRWFIGSPVQYVEAGISNRTLPEIEVEDCAEGVIRYANGVLTSFYTVNYYSYDAPVEIELHCERGLVKMVSDRAVITFDDGRELIADRDPRLQMEFGAGVKGYWGVSHAKQIQDYYRSLAKGEKPFIDGEEARKTQAVVCAVYQSGKERKRIIFETEASFL